MFDAIRARLRALISPAAVDRDIMDEIGGHLEGERERLIAAGMAVEGVLWMGVRDAAGQAVGRFGRLDQPDVDYEAEAEIPIADDEVARMDNDPNYPDLGRLRLIMAGGR